MRSWLPPLHEVLANAYTVALPTRTRFRGITTREAVIFAGPCGASEFSPFPEYVDAEAKTWLHAALDYGWNPVQPEPLRDSVEVNATIPAISAAHVPAMLDRFPGCMTVKVKVAEPGHTLSQDVARVHAVREKLGAAVKLRVDANGGWTVREAVKAAHAFASYRLDYMEQPCATVQELRQLRDTGIGCLIAADESVRKAADPLAVARAGACDLLVVKAAPLGGVAAAAHVIEQAGLPVVVSSAFDTSVGIGMGVRLAASLPAGLLWGACGLATATLLAGDVCGPVFSVVSGRLPVCRPRLDERLLGRWRADVVRRGWWRERVIRCYNLLTD